MVLGYALFLGLSRFRVIGSITMFSLVLEGSLRLISDSVVFRT